MAVVVVMAVVTAAVPVAMVVTAAAVVAVEAAFLQSLYYLRQTHLCRPVRLYSLPLRPRGCLAWSPLRHRYHRHHSVRRQGRCVEAAWVVTGGVHGAGADGVCFTSSPMAGLCFSTLSRCSVYYWSSDARVVVAVAMRREGGVEEGNGGRRRCRR